MRRFPKVPWPARRTLCWGSWFTALILGGFAATGSTSFRATARFRADSGTTAAWVTYRPWRLSLGRAVGEEADGLLPDLPDGWCTRTTIQGVTPWGRWEAAVVTCLLAFRPYPPGSLRSMGATLYHLELSP